MTRIRTLALATTLAFSSAACDGLREAFTAHVDVVAEVGSQELSVTHLAEMLGNARLPLQREAAEGITNIWVDYQLFGHAAAQLDSLDDPEDVDAALWAEIAQSRVGEFYQIIAAEWDDPPEVGEAQYNQGEALAARHILFRVQPTASQEQRDSARLAAERIRGQATAGNFATLARQHSQDGSAEQGGYLGVFMAGDMIPEFESAVRALRPGEISPVIQTQFGYHIVQRSPYGEVDEDFAAHYAALHRQRAESTYMTQLEEAGRVNVRSNAPSVVRRIAENPEDYRNDRTVVATSTAGDLTAGRIAQWINATPPNSQLRMQLAQAPDSVIPMFVRNVVRNELALRQADSAGIEMNEADLIALRGAFASAVRQLWSALGVRPDSLAAAAQAAPERQRLAADKVDQLLAAVVTEQAQYIPMPAPVQNVLRDKYSYSVNDAGIDRALERAQQIRASADSASAEAAPPSQVPMPPASGQQPPPQP